MRNNILLICVFVASLLPRFSAAQSGQSAFEELLKAAQQGELQTVRNLVSKGMAADTADRAGNTLLIIASREGHAQVAAFLIEQKANLQARNAVGDTAIMLAALKGNLELVRLLRTSGAELDQPGWTALHYCAWGGWTEVCRYLIEQGAKVDARAPNLASPLMMAASQGHMDTVKLLLAHSADPSLHNDAGATALSLALKGGHQNVADLLKGIPAAK